MLNWRLVCDVWLVPEDEHWVKVTPIKKRRKRSPCRVDEGLSILELLFLSQQKYIHCRVALSRRGSPAVAGLVDKKLSCWGNPTWTCMGELWDWFVSQVFLCTPPSGVRKGHEGLGSQEFSCGDCNSGLVDYGNTVHGNQNDPTLQEILSKIIKGHFWTNVKSFGHSITSKLMFRTSELTQLCCTS